MARILIVEDSPEGLELMAYLLEAAGHCVRRAASASRALLELRNGPFDLVVCDLQLGATSGVELLRMVRADPRLESIPFVAVSAGAGRDLPGRACALGFAGFFAKPIAPLLFARELEELLQRAHARAPAAAELNERRCANEPRQGLAG
ncbi:MAG: response regulator [Planctomycetes bacterium]|nr:response regulator [Planctomycetota bacterium]